MYNGSKEQPHTVHCSELRKRSKCDIYIREMGAAVCIVTCSKKNTIVVGVFFVLLLFGNWKALANSHHAMKKRYVMWYFFAAHF